MKLTVFATKRTNREGKQYIAYIGRLSKKDGSEITARVKFREECGSPKADDCPINIEFEKADANLSTKEYVREDTGEIGTAYSLWVSKWKLSKDVYVDHSLDDFE